MNNHFVRTTAMILAVCFLSGCFGPFRLTRRVYQWNGSLDNQWGREALFLVMNIIPVYGFAVLADAVFFNLVEFWNGESLLAMAPETWSRKVTVDGRTAVLTMTGHGTALRLDLGDGCGSARSFIIERTADGRTVAKDASGTVLRVARTGKTGGIVIEDGRGKILAE